MAESVVHWTVDYGDGHVAEVSVPHAWRQEVDVRFEGPAIYRTHVKVPVKPSVLRFDAVSYEAVIRIEGEEVLTHLGIWDSFDVPLDRWKGKTVEVEVAVTKNGGTRFPVKEVASGFLPFVFHTFGGIWGEVSIRDSGSTTPSLNVHEVEVGGARIFVDGQPFYVRGLLHWGWYPEIGHPNPAEEVIRREVRAAKDLGFNLVKFCLWVPRHRYLEILEEEGMFAWVELPLWDPSSDRSKLAQIGDEIRRIVHQYASHQNILVWTVGCELGQSTPHEFRRDLVQYVKNVTGSPLVKDNSGGAEMYGGDLREYGDFYDFHPYCDMPFYPSVLDSLLPGPRVQLPVLLGEFNDIDVHRNLVRIQEEIPFWSSAMPELNDQGVRWQHDLPHFIQSNPLATGDDFDRHERLMESTRSKALFIRKTVHEWVRARDPIGGYVVTGWRDTPISTAGFFDDWGNSRFSQAECEAWNSANLLFLIPSRRPPWINGGNRQGWLDPHNHFTGQIYFQIGFHGEETRSGLNWRILDARSATVAQGAELGVKVSALSSRIVGTISWDCLEPGAYRLDVEFGKARNSWKFHVVRPPSVDELASWKSSDGNRLGLSLLGDGPNQIFLDDLSELASCLDDGRNAIVFLVENSTRSAPFWRESGIEFRAGAPFSGEWERLLAVSGDRTLESGAIAENSPKDAKIETIINRVDVRTYSEAPLMVKVSGERSSAIVTTLRPFGGLGLQPRGVDKNAAGADLLRAILELI
jgi:hypothetical protein